MTMEKPFIHESAFVDKGAKIGADTKVWHFCHVMPEAVIGERCVLGQNVVVMNGTKIGNNVKIQNNVSIYEGVELEDNVFCGPSMVFTNVINPRSHVPRKNEFKHTFVRHGATIGANATIVCGITLGKYCFIGAGAVVTKDVPPHALMTTTFWPSELRSPITAPPSTWQKCHTLVPAPICAPSSTYADSCTNAVS